MSSPEQNKNGFEAASDSLRNTKEGLHALQDQVESMRELVRRFGEVLQVFRAKPLPKENPNSPRILSENRYGGSVETLNLQIVRLVVSSFTVEATVFFNGPTGRGYSFSHVRGYKEEGEPSLHVATIQLKAWVATMDEMIGLREAGNDDEFEKRFAALDPKEYQRYVGEKKEAEQLRRQSDSAPGAIGVDPDTGATVVSEAIPTGNPDEAKVPESFEKNGVLDDVKFSNLLRGIVLDVAGPEAGNGFQLVDDVYGTDYHSTFAFRRDGKSYLLDFRSGATPVSPVNDPRRAYHNLVCGLYEVRPDGSRRPLGTVAREFSSPSENRNEFSAWLLRRLEGKRE